MITFCSGKHQFGFRKLHSTASALRDSRLTIASILLSKLELYGITGSALPMIRSYLFDRNKHATWVI